MKKTSLYLIISFVAVCMLSGCGKKEEEIAPDVNISTEDVTEKEDVSGEISEEDLPDDPEIGDEEEKQEKPAEEAWVKAYRSYLYKVMAGFECVPDLLEAVTFVPDSGISFALMDVTEDDIPELLISGFPYDAGKTDWWYLYSLNPEGEVEGVAPFGFYDPETKEIFASTGTSFEDYSVYKINDGKAVVEYLIGEGDVEGATSPYYKCDGNYENQTEVSEEDMNSFREKYNSGLTHHGVSGFELNRENIERELGNESGIDYLNAEVLEDLLKDPEFSEGKSAGDLGYNWMWINESAKVREEDQVLDYYSDWEYSDIISSVKKVDWDNDGIYEFFCAGNPSFGGIYFDMTEDGVLTGIGGFGPYGMGWCDVAYIDDSFWVYEASGNMGKFYDFHKFDPAHSEVDHFCYSIDYFESENIDGEVYCEKGTDPDNMSEIGVEEFEKMCGENGTIYDSLPELQEDDSKDFTEEMLVAIKDFYLGRRPALIKSVY